LVQQEKENLKFAAKKRLDKKAAEVGQVKQVTNKMGHVSAL
jgi:hypothetical protein